MKKKDITKNTMDIKILQQFYAQFHSDKFNIFGKMDKFPKNMQIIKIDKRRNRTSELCYSY